MRSRLRPTPDGVRRSSSSPAGAVMVLKIKDYHPGQAADRIHAGETHELESVSALILKQRCLVQDARNSHPPLVSRASLADEEATNRVSLQSCRPFFPCINTRRKQCIQLNGRNKLKFPARDPTVPTGCRSNGPGRQSKSREARLVHDVFKASTSHGLNQSLSQLA